MTQILGPNENNIDLIDFYIDEISRSIYESNVTRKLFLTTENSTQKIKGTITYQLSGPNDTFIETILTKEQNRNYTSAIINDSTFVNRMNDLWDLYSVDLNPIVLLNINGEEYQIKKHITISNRRYYLIENLLPLPIENS